VLVGQPEGAVEAFERALVRRPARNDLLEIFQALGRVHQRARRDDQALAAWARLEKLFPDDPRVGEQVASALAEEGKLAEALARYEAMAASARDPYRRVRSRAEAADIKVKLGRQGDALRDYEGLLGGLDPESWLFREVRRKIEDVFARDDDPAGLVKYYERWLERSPEDVDAMTRLGKTLASLGRSAEARERFDRALKLAPSRKGLRLALIEQLVAERKFAEAAAQYEAMARAEPNNPDVIREWGKLLLRDPATPQAERRRSAAAVWSRLVEARPDDPSAASQVADLLSQAGMVDEALALYRKAVELAPGSPQYREYLGEYYHTLKRPAEALAAWRGIAPGPGRTASALARLGEVVAGFGYKAEAAEAVTEAARLDPGSLPTRLRLAALLVDLRRFDEADAQLVAAEPLAGDEGRREEVLAARIAADEAAGRLPARIEALKAMAGADPSAWRALARYQEAARRPVEATASAEKAVALDGTSISARSTLARLYEATGRCGESAEVSRALAGLDRRARTEHLSAVARLEARLGRKDEALKAGREVVAATPGNPEALRAYSDLCFQVGEDEQGIAALRRAARIGEADPRALVGLAEVLAREFRTEEAIELFWKAFDRADDLDTRLGHVARLADLHLRRNQFDRLTARLEKLQAEDGKRREATLCLAQAYGSLGDFGAARRQLETLLEADGRDTALLKQLAKLAEDEGDFAAALKYQQMLQEVAPSDDRSFKLAEVAVKAGEVDLAEAIWARSSDPGHDLARVLSAIDGLRGGGKWEPVLAMTGRLLRADPGNWEALYREGRALAALGRPDEASGRYRAILDLRRDDDELGAQVKARRKTGGGSAFTLRAEAAGLSYRANSASSVVQGIAGLSPGYPLSMANAWSPGDFGMARLAALAHELARARRSGTEPAWLEGRRAAAGRVPADPRSAWDDFYVATLLGDNMANYGAAKALMKAAGDDPRACYAFLNALMRRNAPPGIQVIRDSDAGSESRPPLPGDEVDLARDALRSLIKARSPLLNAAILDSATGEMRRAGRLVEFDPDYLALIDATADLSTISVAGYAAGVRGDHEAIRKLSDVFYRSPAASRSAPISSTQPYIFSTPQGSSFAPAVWMAQGIKPLADAKRYGEILRVLDDELVAIRAPGRVAARARSSQSSFSMPAPTRIIYFNYLVKPGVTQSVDYPTPNRHLDGGMILLLRNVFNAFKRDEALPQLVAHFKAVADGASKDPAAERMARLVQGAVLWWAEDRDGSLKAMTRAVELAPGDVDLKLQLAELRSLRREPEEALAVVDSIEAVDQDATRRREWLALRLAVQSARPERARQAAERLFGLRLDSSTQVQLAAQMQQLGMGELADSVLARARRQVGNNAEGLLDLMDQYRRQGNVDAAVQIALQVLRRSLSQAATRIGGDDPDQKLAIEVLAGSGKLGEMIERVEGQVRQSPRSLTLQQTLAAYYQAAGRLDKLRATNEAIIALRPDDIPLRMQAAGQLAASGDVPAALAHYRSAFKIDPSAFSNYSRSIIAALQQAGRIDDLVKLLDEVGLKSFDSPILVRRLIQTLMADPKTLDHGLKLVVKGVEAYPDDAATLLDAAVTVASFWDRPDAYELARAAVLPRPGASTVAPWAGRDVVIPVGGWGADGKLTTLVSRLLDAASRLGKLDDLAASIEATLGRSERWTAGRALLGAVRLRQGRTAEGRGLLEPIPADTSGAASFEVLLILAQEARDAGGLDALATAFYERANKADRALTYASLSMKPSSVRQLARLYRKAGRAADAVAVANRAEEGLRALFTSPNAALSAYRRVNSLGGLGQLYLELGDLADALRVFDEVLGSDDEIELARTYPTRDVYPGVDSILAPALEGFEAARKSLADGAIAPTLAALIRPGDPARPVDLRLTVHPREVDRAALDGLLPACLGLAGRDPGVRSRVKGDLDAIAKGRPDDWEARIALALLAGLGDDPGALAAEASTLDRMAEASPLEPLPPRGRPDARRRDEAARRLGLWLVARSCWAHDSTAEVGDRLAARALDAARRQLDPRWTLAMLRERGQRALDRGDRPAAEAQWSALLEQILDDELAPSTPGRPTAPDRPEASKGRLRVPPASVARFRQAAELSRLAAEHGLAELSLRAVRESLKGGPPVVPVALASLTLTGSQRASIASATSDAPPDPTTVLVAARLVELDAAWSRAMVPPLAAYEALRDAVLPASRPSEVFPYDPSTAHAAPGSPAAARPGEVARALVRRAVASGRADDLRGRLAARQQSPAGKAAARRILAALEEAEKGP